MSIVSQTTNGNKGKPTAVRLVHVGSPRILTWCCAAVPSILSYCGGVSDRAVVGTSYVGSPKFFSEPPARPPQHLIFVLVYVHTNRVGSSPIAPLVFALVVLFFYLLSSPLLSSPLLSSSPGAAHTAPSAPVSFLERGFPRTSCGARDCAARGAAPRRGPRYVIVCCMHVAPDPVCEHRSWSAVRAPGGGLVYSLFFFAVCCLVSCAARVARGACRTE